MRRVLGPIKRDQSVERRGQLFGNVACRLENESVKCQVAFVKLSGKCRDVMGMSGVDQFWTPMSSVGLKNWTMPGVGKTPFMGPSTCFLV